MPQLQDTPQRPTRSPPPPCASPLLLLPCPSISLCAPNLKLDSRSRGQREGVRHKGCSHRDCLIGIEGATEIIAARRSSSPRRCRPAAPACTAAGRPEQRSPPRPAATPRPPGLQRAARSGSLLLRAVRRRSARRAGRRGRRRCCWPGQEVARRRRLNFCTQSAQGRAGCTQPQRAPLNPAGQAHLETSRSPWRGATYNQQMRAEA